MKSKFIVISVIIILIIIIFIYFFKNLENRNELMMNYSQNNDKYITLVSDGEVFDDVEVVYKKRDGDIKNISNLKPKRKKRYVKKFIRRKLEKMPPHLIDLNKYNNKYYNYTSYMKNRSYNNLDDNSTNYQNTIEEEI